ncbi:uncharacterized protein LOC112088938, partial [Eutrema salsugineum]|uniref:uncharacterized protein LOC112088938 n=1 Tax=Eutrema salsugineum TaxID=72664 RepID=UPI000CED6945
SWPWTLVILLTSFPAPTQGDGSCKEMLKLCFATIGDVKAEVGKEKDRPQMLKCCDYLIRPKGRCICGYLRDKKSFSEIHTLAWHCWKTPAPQLSDARDYYKCP